MLALFKKLCLVFVVLTDFFISPAHGECISLIKGPIVLDIRTCGRFIPEKSFKFENSQYSYVLQYPPKDKKILFDGYRGLYARGRIALSRANRSGLDEKKGVLHGEEQEFFFPPGTGNCRQILGKRLRAALREACCDEGVDAPCMLPSRYVIDSYRSMGTTRPGLGNKKRMALMKRKDYRLAEMKYTRKQFAGAAKLMARVKAKVPLDIRGLYKLAHSYRELDSCGRAIPVLQELYQREIDHDYWIEDEAVVRKGVFMLARCYAKENQPGGAVEILNFYLGYPQKYKREIVSALRHPDFGWIKTSKDFSHFRTEAATVLRRQKKASQAR